jgi:hypothetical protein
MFFEKAVNDAKRRSVLQHWLNSNKSTKSHVTFVTFVGI